MTPTTVPAGRVTSQMVAPPEGTTRSRGMETPGWRRIASRIAACLYGKEVSVITADGIENVCGGYMRSRNWISLTDI